MNKRNLDPKFLSDLAILDSAEAASYLRLGKTTLARHRMFGTGPKFIRQSSRKNLYRKTDLDAWLDARIAN